MKKWLSIILIVVLFLLVAAEFVLPQMVQGLVASSMGRMVPSGEITTEVAKHPAVAMLVGQFGQMSVQAEHVKIDKVVFDHMDVNLDTVELDMGALVRDGKVVIKSAKHMYLTAVITQEELARYLNESAKGVKNAVVTVKDGRVQLVGALSLGPIATMAVTVEGKVVGDGQKIKYVSDHFLINSSSIGQLGGGPLAEIQLVDLKKLPFGVVVRTITMADGKITIIADNDSN
jgi:hypothetical protein